MGARMCRVVFEACVRVVWMGVWRWWAREGVDGWVPRGGERMGWMGSSVMTRLCVSLCVVAGEDWDWKDTCLAHVHVCGVIEYVIMHVCMHPCSRVRMRVYRMGVQARAFMHAVDVHTHAPRLVCCFDVPALAIWLLTIDLMVKAGRRLGGGDGAPRLIPENDQGISPTAVGPCMNALAVWAPW